MSVMPTWTVERNRPGSCASASAAVAPRSPAAAMVFSRTSREDTTASSERAKSPFRAIRTTAMTSSSTILDRRATPGPSFGTGKMGIRSVAVKCRSAGAPLP